jgi:hypothetical protein
MPTAPRAGLRPLHGVPVGLKDIIDTADMPTEDGTVLHAGRTPDRDAAVVAQLRAAGAVILGKTVTTELATYAPGKTRNPHDPAHAGRVVVGLGGGGGRGHGAAGARHADQRLGDPAGRVLRRGRLQAQLRADPAPRHPEDCLATLDTVGVFARSPRGPGAGRRVADRLRRERRPDTVRAPASRSSTPRRAAALAAAAGVREDAGLGAHRSGTREAFAELCEALGAIGRRGGACPTRWAEAWDWHRTIMEAEMAFHPRRRVGARPRAAVRLAAGAARARPRDHGAGLPARAGARAAPGRGLRRACSTASTR